MDSGWLGGAAASAAPTAIDSATAGFTLGFDEEGLSELKPEVVSVLAPPKKKRAKFTHDFFFEDEGGFKKILTEFPKIRFRGKGHEFEDLTKLLGHYHRYFQGLEPSANEMLEDAVWITRNKLAEREKDDAGKEVSNPRERLHKFRAMYKMKWRSAVTAGAGPSGGPARIEASISDEQKKRIEENKKRALERKRQKELEARQLEDDHAAHAAPMHFDEEEDVFGLGFGMEDDSPGQKPATTVQASGGVGLSASGAGDESESQTELLKQQKELEELEKAEATKAAPMHFGEEEDVFGFGFGFDDEPFDRGPATAVQANDSAPGGGQVRTQISENQQQRMEANRQRALALRRQKQAKQEVSAQAVQSATPQADPQDVAEQHAPALAVQSATPLAGPREAAERQVPAPAERCATPQAGSREATAPVQALESVLTAEEELALEADALAFEYMDEDDVFGHGFGFD